MIKEKGISISQPKYTLDLLRRFKMENCNACSSPFQSGVKLTLDCTTPLVDATLYRQLVGSLLYLTHTRPDISFAVSLCSRYMQKPHESHWNAAKRILRYLKGTVYLGLHYVPSDSDLVLTGYSDSDWASDVDDRKSTAGYVFSFGSAPVIWNSKKIDVHALSTTEAEYRALLEAGKEAIWIRSFLEEIGFPLKSSITFHVDNVGAKEVATHPVSHSKMKHVELHLYWIRDYVAAGIFRLVHCPTHLQVADIFTKSFSDAKFSKLLDLLGVTEIILKGGFE